jgi:hypothetical protein
LWDQDGRDEDYPQARGSDAGYYSTDKNLSYSLNMSTSIDYDSKKEDPSAYYAQEGVVEPVVLEDANPATQHYAVKRVMTTRQIQFYAIGGTIGTAVFVSVSTWAESDRQIICGTELISLTCIDDDDRSVPTFVSHSPRHPCERCTRRIDPDVPLQSNRDRCSCYWDTSSGAPSSTA